MSSIVWEEEDLSMWKGGKGEMMIVEGSLRVFAIVSGVGVLICFDGGNE